MLSDLDPKSDGGAVKNKEDELKKGIFVTILYFY